MLDVYVLHYTEHRSGFHFHKVGSKPVSAGMRQLNRKKEKTVCVGGGCTDWAMNAPIRLVIADNYSINM